jgi:hypothetical protein
LIIDPSSQQEFSDADFRIVDNGDQSKKLAFEVSGIATGTTRTWTSQDANGTVAYVNNQTFTGTTTVNVLSVTGGQIAFPATANPSAGANTLDEYEEGTFTPAWTGSSVNPAIGNGSLTGRYTKIGRVVQATVTMVTGSTSTYGTGFYGWGLPFAAVDVSTTVELTGLSMMANDVSTTLRYQGLAVVITSTTMGAFVPDSATLWQSTSPFTWATGDRLFFSLSYQASA